MATITTEMIKKLREATSAGILDCRKALESADGDIDVYSEGNGRVVVMVEVNCETDFVGRSEKFREFAHEVALQIAATAPQFIREEDVQQSVLDHEAEIATAKAREEGKKDAIIPKIVEGAVAKFKDEFILLRRKYIRDDSKTIQDLMNETIVSTGENIVIRRFARWALGESTNEE